MAKWIVVDEIHLTIRIPANHSKSSVIARTLKSKQFQTRLQTAINGVLQSQPSLRGIKIAVSR